MKCPSRAFESPAFGDLCDELEHLGVQLGDADVIQMASIFRCQSPREWLTTSLIAEIFCCQDRIAKKD